MNRVIANVPSCFMSGRSPVQFSAYRHFFVVCLCHSVLQNGPPSRQLTLVDLEFTPDAARLYTANKEFSNKLSTNSVIGYITASLLTIPPTLASFEACQRSFRPHSSLPQNFALSYTVLELNLHLRKVKC